MKNFVAEVTAPMTSAIMDQEFLQGLQKSWIVLLELEGEVCSLRQHYSHGKMLTDWESWGFSES